MNTTFWIQTPVPTLTGLHQNSDESVCEALQTTLSSDSEYCILVWDFVFVPLSYKHDISLICDDLALLSLAVRANDTGQLSNSFPSNTFCVTWELAWSANTVRIDAKWQSTLGATEEALRSRPSISVDRRLFLEQVRKLLVVCATALNSSDYHLDTLSDGANLARAIAPRETTDH